MTETAPNMRNQKGVLGKDDVRADIGVSTDLSDALIHALMGPILAAHTEDQEQFLVVRQSEYRIGDY